MLNYNKEDVQYAGFFVRLSAYILDCIIIGTALLVVKIPKFIGQIINPDGLFFKPVLFKFSTIDILIYLLGLSYFVIMTYIYGATLGKKALNIKVCKSNEEKLTLIDVIYRESIGRYLSSIIIFLGYIIIFADSKKRGFHDILCDTVVIYNFKGKKNIDNYNINNNSSNSNELNITNDVDQKSPMIEEQSNSSDSGKVESEINLDKLSDNETDVISKVDLDKED